MKQAFAALLRDRDIRFLITGGGAALLLYALTFAFLRTGAPAFLGTLAAYAITVVASYTVQQAWTFGGHHRHADAFPRYLAAQVLSAGTTAVVAQTMSRLGTGAAPLALVTTLLGSALSYSLSRFWVFARRKDAQVAQTTTACSTRPASPNTRR